MSDREKIQTQNDFDRSKQQTQNDFAIKLAGVQNMNDIKKLQAQYNLQNGLNPDGARPNNTNP